MKIIISTTLIIFAVLQFCVVWHAAVAATQRKDVSVLTATNASRIFLERHKRYLLFEKGATFMVQTNIAKAIVSEMPRGLNEIAEYTLMYELPHEARLWQVDEQLQHKSNPNTPTPLLLATANAEWPWKYWQQMPYNVAAQYGGPAFADKRHWQQQQQHLQAYTKAQPSQQLPQCHKVVAYGATKRPMLWCRAKLSPYKRHGRVAREQAHIEDPASALFYDLIERWAVMHDFNARHCIMRSLCEAQHLLLPPGHSLLHDLLRILLNYALPAARRNVTFRAAIGRTQLQECMLLYGPHCPVSFLQHFSSAVHGKAYAA